MALMSGKIYSNTGTPSNADGIDGDIYLRLDGMKTTYRKESGAWVAVGSTLGAIPEIISGVGAPSNALGADEQYYRDTSNQNIYYKQGSMWNLVGNLTGATFAAALDKAGIGKDLATAPNLINSGSLNTVVVEGQYSYTEDVTDTPTPNGLVWVKQTYARTNVWQFVEGSNNTLYHRISGDNGATWSAWKTYVTSSEIPEDTNIPTGGMIMWPSTIIPSGYIEANGQASPPSLVPIYGSNVPDMRGAFPRGFDNGRGVDAGRVLLSEQASTTIGDETNGSSGVILQNTDGSEGSFNVQNNTSTNDTVSNTQYKIRPFNIAWVFIIKT